MPTARWPFLDHDGPIAFAHRGAHIEHGVTETSTAAVARAVELGFRYVETDVHATSDGRLVAFHDDVLDRTTDRTGRIIDLPWSEVRRARLVEGDDGVPLLEDLLGAWPDLRVNVDAKADTAVEPLVDVIARTDAWDRVCLAAFSDRRLDRLRALTDNRCCSSMGPRDVARLRAASVHIPAGAFTAQCAQVPTHQGPIPIVDRRFVAAAHDRGLEVHVWTIDDRAEMERLLDLGVDGIMTDRPDVLKDVLTARGAWT
jgi:glycerophosphoryl diester phosphodiesterase